MRDRFSDLEKLGCQEITTATQGHGIRFWIPIRADKYYVTNYAVKAMDSNTTLSMGQEDSGGAVWNGTHTVNSDGWTHFLDTFKAGSTGIAKSLMISSAAGQKWRVSAFQCHEFDNWNSAVNWQRCRHYTPVSLTSVDVTPDNSTNDFDATAHGLSDDDQVYFTATTAPTGLTVGERYYIVNSTTDTFQVSLTVGGAVETFTTDGSNVKFKKLTPVEL